MNKILVVEDEKLIRQGIVMMIRRSGVPVTEILEAPNGEMALELINGQTIDVVFTDIRMPRMDGLELVKAVRAMSAPPLIIAISGYDEFNYAVEMLRMGVRDYLLKPVERAVLVKLLGQLHEEIDRKNNQAREQRLLGFRQLKYLIGKAEITAAELQALTNRYGETFLTREYIVCCCNRIGSNSGELDREHYLCLNDVEGHEIYLIEWSEVPDWPEQGFRDRYVGISARHCGLAELKPAFLEAVAARQKAFWQSKKMAVHTSEEESAGKITESAGKITENVGKMTESAGKMTESTVISESEIEQIVQQMGTDKEETARHRLNEIFHYGRRGRYQPPVMEKMAERLLERLWATYGTLVAAGTGDEILFKEIYRYGCGEELAAALNQWLDRLSEQLKRDFDDYRNKQKIKQALLYINENYCTDLNMAVVSNVISMNYSLFSHTFKLYTGSKFVDYIKELRIKEAKRLLETTELRVNEISQLVGYENDKHFMKMFKGVCGVSPTEYRKNMLYKERIID